ncbi:MAG: hypothetical protein QM582_14195 [Micropruina sp.]|uniref:hypothetical protein n=1 Tax=Micropruina sp. TaxID=2737536 RepID=UPI0039E4227D
MSAQRDVGQSMLQVIFSFFLGLVVTAFIGIGVNTFYPEPPYSSGGESAWSTYRLTTSIILLVCATLVMLLSLAIANSGPVLANGALLGGLFTMIYAVGMGISAGEQWPRFAVLTVALVITVAVGWWKFSRGRTVPAAASAPSGAVGALPVEVEARLTAVEAKLDALGRALRD